MAGKQTLPVDRLRDEPPVVRGAALLAKPAIWDQNKSCDAGAMAFQKGLGCVHSLSHSLGGLNPRLHHGTLNALLLPAVLEFNAVAPSVVAERRMERIARAMALESAADVPDAVRDMNKHLGLPGGLGELGIVPSLFPRIIEGALKDHTHKTNPREASALDYQAMLDRSL
jgi:4-hydroxybutyrate dehydrogenase